MRTLSVRQPLLRNWRDALARLPQPASFPAVATASLGYTAVASLLGWVLSRWLQVPSIGLLYILAVVIGAIALGMRTGLSVAFLSFLAYNFFFIPPVYTFAIADPQELFALFVFLAVAIVSGSLAGLMREAIDVAHQRTRALGSLNEFAARLSAARETPAILDDLTRQAAECVAGEAIALMKGPSGLEPQAWWPSKPELMPDDWHAAIRVLRSSEVAFAAAPGWPGPRFEIHPLIVGHKVVGVLGVRSGQPLSRNTLHIASSLHAIVRHAAIAIERISLEDDAVRAKGDAERERLRAALLSSLSHDLRTPLASIVGAVTSLRDLGAGMPQETRDDLLLAIQEEAERMARYVANLLQLTRLEAGDIALMSEWIDLADIVRAAVARAKGLRPAPKISMQLPISVTPARGNTALLESVVFNLIENAVKFSDDIADIEVVVASEAKDLVLSVSDGGRGIALGLREKVFEPFFRAKDIEGSTSGTGLGLTIAKRIVEGIGGSIAIDSPIRDERGTRVVIRLPTSDIAADSDGIVECRS